MSGYIIDMKTKQEIFMTNQTLITIYNHDDETSETITLTQFVKRFNNEQIDSTSFTITSTTEKK